MVVKNKTQNEPDTSDKVLYALVDKLEANRQKRRPIEAKLAPLEVEMQELKAQIMSVLNARNETNVRTTHATVSISEIERVIADDIETAFKAAKKQGWLHIFDFKVAAVKEYKEKMGKELPGTHTEVVRRQLNHTSVK